MATFVYHNNQHRSNHHTVALSGYPESSKDPIASQNYPFQGIFYNKLYDDGGLFIGEDNSYNWWSSFTTVKAQSAVWEKYITTYTTVCANSGIWELGANAYNTFYPLSGNWLSTNNTVQSNIANWNLILEPNKVYSNQVQEYTRQKTFRAPALIPPNPNNIIWNLSAGQVTTYSTSANSYFSGFEGNKKGGIYNIIIVKTGSSPLQINVEFNIFKYKLPNNINTFTIQNGYAMKFQFLSDGEFLHGKYSTYNLGIVGDQFVYYSGDGVILYVGGNPVQFVQGNFGDEISPESNGGIIVHGVIPYSNGDGILIV